MESLERQIIDGKNEINKLNLELRKIKELLNNFSKILSEKTPKETISTGNQGVFRHTPVEDPLTFRQPVDTKSHINALKSDISSKFKKLTEMEFKVFMTIYQLEEEKNRAISYHELAEKLELSLSSIRDHISNILLKKIPLTKHTTANRRVFLSIPQEFRDLNLASKLIRLRNFDNSQKTLFD